MNIVESSNKTPKVAVSWLNSKLELRESAINGWGIFAKEKIKKNERLAIFGGTICSFDEVMQMTPHARKYCLQIDDNMMIATSKNGDESDATDYFNHSCDPNSGILGQIILVAMRDIMPDDEITFDYAMVITRFVGVKNSIDCECGASCCRKIITADDWQLPELQTKYKTYFSSYILQRINEKKYY